MWKERKKKEASIRVKVELSFDLTSFYRDCGSRKGTEERCSFIFLGREHMCCCKPKKSVISLESDFYRCRTATSVRWTFWNNADTLWCRLEICTVSTAIKHGDKVAVTTNDLEIFSSRSRWRQHHLHTGEELSPADYLKLRFSRIRELSNIWQIWMEIEEIWSKLKKNSTSLRFRMKENLVNSRFGVDEKGRI